MTKETLLLLTAIMSSPLIGMWIKAVFDRSKTGAETHNLNISGEISIGDAWKKYAEKMEERFNNLSTQFDVLEKKFDLLTEDRRKLVKEIAEKENKNKQLIVENLALAKVNEDYKTRIGILENKVEDMGKLLEDHKIKDK